MEKKILKALMQHSGLSHKDFANKIGINPNNLTGWLNGTRTPKMSKLDEIAALFDLEIKLSYNIIPNTNGKLFKITKEIERLYNGNNERELSEIFNLRLSQTRKIINNFLLQKRIKMEKQ